MLPRSDGLRSYEEARNWLLETFASKIKQGALESANLCLIGHYFIPSIASAWARAIPSERIVRIESLWGIPEGLYWYSHDTYEVDTQNVQLNQDSILSEQYTVKERLRFKGTFVAPDQSGKWKPLQTKQPFDLRRSINHKNWLFEIAHKTRQIAELERYPVSVMWFVDNHHHATEHKVLPWFHSKLQMIEQPKAAPRQKRKSASDYKIQSSEDFIRLQSDLESGKYIERVIIAPEDAALIRDQDFAKKLALLAKTKGFVIELAGGILSHAFYILQREGAQVECVDLFGADEDIVEYYKIVRDKIPQIIERRGERVDTIQLTGDALVQALQKKLVEEAFEAFDAREGMDILAELADLQEVIKALCSSIGASTNDLETERKRKEMHRGGFEKGLMLTKTTTPHSIQKLPSSANPSNIETIMLPIPKPIISIASSLLDQPIYRRPDLRMVNQQPEKLFTFETEVAKANVNDTQSFSMPYGSKIQDYGITIELKRIKSKIRAIIRLRSGPSQLQLQFPNETK
jgi:predicted house-cleaning noncanonical NTP pyrophosphatase (MazG superfamily)